MGLYQDLRMLKTNGELLDENFFEELKDSFNNNSTNEQDNNVGILEELFDIRRTRSKLIYRPRKLGQAIKNAILDEFLYALYNRAKKKNMQVKEEILKNENLDMISKAVAHFIFQNGPIKGMLSCPNKKLSEEDLKILRRFMVNRLSYIFTLIIEERWIEFDFLVRNIHEVYGHEGEDAKPDDGGTRKLIETMLEWKSRTG